MLPQDRLIVRVRELCHSDARLVAALTYGSFPQGLADEHSDLEFWLFFSNDAAATVDKRSWLDGIGPIRHVIVNEFGTHVAFFANLVRGEFHFATAADIPSVAAWPARSAPTDHMVVLDRTGLLRRTLDSLPSHAPVPTTPDEIEELCGRFANWLVLTHHVAQRGELLRALDALSHTHRYLLWMARLAGGHTQRWLTPAKSAESDLPAEVVTAIYRTTTTADPTSLSSAVAAAWACGRTCWQHLAHSAGVEIPDLLFTDLDAALSEHISSSGGSAS